MRFNFSLYCISIGILLSYAALEAKRLYPKRIQPIVSNHIEYSVDHHFIGTITIKNMKTKQSKVIQIYVIQYDPDLEKDIQDVFIKSIKLEKEHLIITNEAKNEFSMDTKTLLVKKLH